ncbi:hypothetical protein K2P56_01190 [Patescibacteria group bacterium]|nr:hypothetical protein [Patescibacteria group bacterium]
MEISEILKTQNLDIFIIGLVAVAIGIFGFIVFFNNPKSLTNRSFLFASITVILWGALNLIVFRLTDPTLIIWTLRAAVFFAVWHAFSVFQLFYVFPKPAVVLPSWYRFLLIPFVGLVSLLTLTPLVFQGVENIVAGQVATVTNGPAVPVFGITVILLHLSALLIIFKKLFASRGSTRSAYTYIATGTLVTYTLILIFNFVFPAILNNPTFAPFAGVFTFPFIFLTAYAITKHHLLDIKILATQFIVGLLALTSLLEIFFADDFSQIVFRLSIFVLILVTGVLLIRSVMKEVEQREQIQELAKNLQLANEKLKELDKLKSEFLSIASHDLRAPLTVIRNYVSLVLDGSYGKMPKAAEEGLHQVFERATDMAKSVDTYLNVSRIEQGRMKYDFINVDLAPILKKAVKDFTPNAEKKGVHMTFTLNPELENKKARLDVAKINEVFNNLLDNSIKYTPKGTISVVAEKVGSVARITLKDTGIGMSKETIAKLFQLFSAGENSLKINIASTGVGLYITKAHVLAHKGKIWAESDGEGKGSRFILELPLLN